MCDALPGHVRATARGAHAGLEPTPTGEEAVALPTKPRSGFNPRTPRGSSGESRGTRGRLPGGALGIGNEILLHITPV